MATNYDTQALRKISILTDLPPWQMEVIAEAVEPIIVRKGSVIVERGSDDGFTYFLTEGEITLEAADGATKMVEAGPQSTRTPIANLRPRIFSVRAESQVRAIRVPDIVLSAAGCSGRAHDPNEIMVQSEEERDRREAESRLSFQLYRDLQSDQAILPSLPDLALRIRRAIDDEVSDAKAIAKLVESDPAMATKLLKAANSALYGGLSAVETCPAAVVRLGMDTTKQLVLTFALKEVFRNQDPMIQKRMQVLWKHSANIAAICFVLARQVKGMQPEEALLIGLVHDVGAIAILNYIEKYPELAESEAILEDTIARMRGELGAMILRKWNFGPAVVAGARDAEQWNRLHNRAPDFTDLLVVAQVHERLRKDQIADLPPMEDITAIKRVLGEEASPERSLQILHEAKAQIDEMRSVLRG
jgi:HD-like signal output (HDOD) protein